MVVVSGSTIKPPFAVAARLMTTLDVCFCVLDGGGHKFNSERRRCGFCCTLEIVKGALSLGSPREPRGSRAGSISLAIASHLPMMPAS